MAAPLFGIEQVGEPGHARGGGGSALRRRERMVLSLSLLGVVLLASAPVAGASRAGHAAPASSGGASVVEAPVGVAVAGTATAWTGSGVAPTGETASPSTADAPRAVASAASAGDAGAAAAHGAGVLAPTGAATASLAAPRQPARATDWQGVVAPEGANRRSAPRTDAAILGELRPGTPVLVSGWVAGGEAVRDNPTWARLDDGGYVYSAALRPVALSAPPIPPAAAAGETGRWIDLNLTQQVIVAYAGRTPVHVARTSTGRPGWETPEGVYRIQRRVADETMSSARLPLAQQDQAQYLVEHVRWTQYFSADGTALHENYWKPRDEIGIPSSHGCAGLAPEDAQFFWDWASEGTPIYAHR